MNYILNLTDKYKYLALKVFIKKTLNKITFAFHNQNTIKIKKLNKYNEIIS